ncbi:hypothetical protein ACG74X_19920 [Marivita sp. S0852]|uniref:hypothetical protein n=1 Tax=Marivita sp. S0852 TaxID=3373893 RepID=UPI00398214A9
MDNSQNLNNFADAFTKLQKVEIERRVQRRYALNKSIKNLERGNAVSSMIALFFYLFLIAAAVVISIFVLLAAFSF